MKILKNKRFFKCKKYFGYWFIEFLCLEGEVNEVKGAEIDLVVNDGLTSKYFIGLGVKM